MDAFIQSDIQFFCLRKLAQLWVKGLAWGSNSDITLLRLEFEPMPLQSETQHPNPLSHIEQLFFFFFCKMLCSRVEWLYLQYLLRKQDDCQPLTGTNIFNNGSGAIPQAFCILPAFQARWETGRTSSLRTKARRWTLLLRSTWLGPSWSMTYTASRLWWPNGDRSGTYRESKPHILIVNDLRLEVRFLYKFFKCTI